jgi:hypothetical protein
VSFEILLTGSKGKFQNSCASARLAKGLILFHKRIEEAT